MNYFGITVEGNVVLLGSFDTVAYAENAAADYGTAEACEACGHASDDTVYFGSREHFNEVFDKLEASENAKQVRYCVDGHEFENEESGFIGDGRYPPFVVFDIEAQDNLPGTYATREDAQVVADRLNERAS